MDVVAKHAAAALIKRAAKYLRDDAARRYALLEPAAVRIEGEGAGRYAYRDGILEIVPDGADAVAIRVQPFPAASGEWDGASAIPDADQGATYDDGRTEASLYHDLIYKRLSLIAACNRSDERAVREWADGVLVAVWAEYARRKGRGGRRARIMRRLAWRALRSPLYRVWRRIRLILLLFAIGLSIVGCSSCSSPPEWRADVISPVVFSNAVPAAVRSI